MLWTDHTLTPINDTDPYIDADGVQHLGQRDKSSIDGLMRVALTDRPDDAPTAYTIDGQPRGGVEVTGWRIEMIDGQPTQVWDVAARPALTEVEATAITARDRKVAAQTALDASDKTVLRCIEAGVAVPADWLAYRGALRAIVTDPTSADALPPRPDWPTET